MSYKLYTEPIYLVVPEKHWLTNTILKDLKVLQDEKFIISGLHRITYFPSLLRSLFQKNGFEPKTVIESDFGGMIVNLVAQGLGISILPLSYKFSNAIGVRFIALDETISLFMNWRKNDPNRIAERVVKLAKKMTNPT
ncbi:LysR substrate-binding domain-containing protein [Maribacter sp.]|uniref:LysR substrate-binding domain-containing protein n=1 Tax=Maribacter sp. TaxID=1897614 RepID=UPI0025BAAE47|nr:LysR substrate-binding domain-containing protein [Maribacter sp.]